jgi:predicted transcriptional regulator
MSLIYTISLGYTPGMKTAISLPDELFQQAEELARQTRRSRSQLYADAVREYIARHMPDTVTEAMDRVLEELDGRPDEFTKRSARRVLQQTQW